MRRLIITENITVDGVIDAAGGWFDPASGNADVSDIEDEIARQRASADAFLTGRVTFEAMRGYWTAQTDDDTTGIAEYLDRVAKYVVSNSLTDPEWEPTTILHDVLDVELLKAERGGDIVCTGSIRLARGLIAARLVDEFRLFVYPVVLGKGERLFVEAEDMSQLELVDARPFRSGVVLLHYRTGGLDPVE
ncbi:MAG: dihydrofolate reductase family protein [Solirubrobacteraceae bacterium]